MPDSFSPAPEGFQPTAALAAVAFPGAGHMVLGDRKRGWLIAAGVLGLFFGGLLVGGIGVVDSRDNRVWFLGQALVGPVAFGVDYLHQHHFKVIDPSTGRLRPANPDEGRDPATGRAVQGGKPPYIRSLAKANELGTLFATIAGMMNLIAILDAAMPTPRKPGGAA